MQDVYPTLEVNDDVLAPLGGQQLAWLEIGFGASEHLIWQARANPHVLIMGAEPFLNGVAKAVLGVQNYGLSNVRLWQGDGREILERLPDGSLERVFVLFPDPWPKARHNKRRIISDAFVAELHRVLQTGGRFRFASDIIHYVDWSLTRIRKHGGFALPVNTYRDWRVRPDDWPETRYEAKAKREGRPCHYFEFVKT